VTLLRRLLTAVAREIPSAARAAFPMAVACSGLLIGEFLILFTPVGVWL
jgi:hypothetical protein